MQPNRRQLIQLLSLAGIAGCAGIAGSICGCRSAPRTGRRQLMLSSQHREDSLGRQAYQDILEKEPASQNLPLFQLVSRVGQRISKAAKRPEVDWQFHLFAGDRESAVALPGGNVAVFEGILPYCVNEAGLAVVISHEIAHVLARHGGERMSQTSLRSGAKNVLDRITHSGGPNKNERFLLANGISSDQSARVPFSQTQESEADQIGVMLMAMAGYDPNEAPRFWQRFNTISSVAQAANAESCEFVSIHPTDQRRALNLMALMGEAEQYYSAAEDKHGIGQVIVRVDQG